MSLLKNTIVSRDEQHPITIDELYGVERFWFRGITRPPNYGRRMGSAW